MTNNGEKQQLSPVNPGAFWRFSCAFYAEAGVEALAIELQEAGGWDVNLALFALWLAAEDREPGEAALEAAVAFSAEWRAAAVAPLRAARRGLKLRASADPAVAALRAEVKALELKAEQLQQERLESLAASAVAGAPGREGFAARARRGLARLGALQRGAAAEETTEEATEEAARFDRLVALAAAWRAKARLTD